ncbi:6878_t:CDS:1, partial [Gigaspora rosea]
KSKVCMIKPIVVIGQLLGNMKNVQSANGNAEGNCDVKSPGFSRRANKTT